MTPGAVAVSIALVQRLQGMSQWILWEISAFFEAVGTVQDGVEIWRNFLIPEYFRRLPNRDVLFGE